MGERHGLHYLRSCQFSPHQPTNHHGGNARCDCPCHLGSKANPWWRTAEEVGRHVR